MGSEMCIRDRDKAADGMLNRSGAVGTDALMGVLKNYCRSLNLKTAITVGVIGYPNVGKSSLINSLKRCALVLSRIQLTAHPSCDSPNTSRRFALGASDVCLVGENPTCSVPAFWSHAYQEYTRRPPTFEMPSRSCLLYTSPSPRDLSTSRMPSSA